MGMFHVEHLFFVFHADESVPDVPRGTIAIFPQTFLLIIVPFPDKCKTIGQEIRILFRQILHSATGDTA